jgi:hypothetical protein
MDDLVEDLAQSIYNANNHSETQIWANCSPAVKDYARRMAKAALTRMEELDLLRKDLFFEELALASPVLVLSSSGDDQSDEAGARLEKIDAGTGTAPL